MATYNISEDIWQRKYRYQGSDTIPPDGSLEETMQRVARAAAANEPESERWRKEFAGILTTLEFIPGGRIVANAGTAREEVTMFNCYVMNRIDDSIEGIFETVKESALTQKQGGGVGFDFSTIRPRGSQIKGCEAEASGPISFMQVLDSTCRTIMSAGQRRGAQMGILRCDHPDIEAFIKAKRENSQLQMFNLSVAVTDKFIAAVKANADWDLVFDGVAYKTIRARELWDRIMRSTYDYAEPGFILIDRINHFNNLYYCENICATNPCGEQPLPPYGACLLGSVNLTRFVRNPFQPEAAFDFERLAEVVPVAVRLLDNVIELSNYPLEAQRQEAKKKRRMGIGVTGLADALIFLGIKYGTPESTAMVEKIMSAITRAAYRASVELAKEKGAFELFDAGKYLAGNFVKTLPQDIRDAIGKYGIRNSHLTSIAPTGTISLLAGNVSSGLEPVFAFKYTRRIRNGAETDVSEVEVLDYAYRKYCECRGGKTIELADLPDYFVSADRISPEEHVEIQAALQKYADSSISKTINIPADYPFDKFADIYLLAYEKGLKGCTTFRPSEHLTGVLIRPEDNRKKDAAADPGLAGKRPDELPGTTYKIKTPMSPDAFYITINDQFENGCLRPYELFINTRNLQHFSWIVAISRLISAVFRHEPKPFFLVEELKSVYDPNGGYFKNGKYVPSLAAEIGLVIEQHLNSIGLAEEKKSKKKAAPAALPEGQDKLKMICPHCNERAVIYQEDCMKCLACGYSRCN
ncbi:adenosylcobalamin-dependent ribonucleoside-diphosphate reductase [Victivallis sp. Marseille-Q1083]|uniref:adenosylcobalamin-dependent ribonucleoside-diphosphate reductase n=1 Tax=Victivallis sp. Marseille-Q1083 TaxID=2717288 RepID=UPI00158B6150|nr:adenosylcobalamin-dependent ribonucleoside-diphosphate reductase [Victivallis sp. Marseille-Q1083]